MGRTTSSSKHSNHIPFAPTLIQYARRQFESIFGPENHLRGPAECLRQWNDYAARRHQGIAAQLTELRPNGREQEQPRAERRRRGPRLSGQGAGADAHAGQSAESGQQRGAENVRSAIHGNGGAKCIRHGKFGCRRTIDWTHFPRQTGECRQC